jgi:cell shape-determining protein MreC
MTASWSIESMFQMVQTIAILLGIPVIAFRLGRGAESLKSSIKTQGLIVTNLANEFRELKDEQKEFRKVLTEVSLQNQRLDNQGSQITQLFRTVDDLRRGEGFIMPIGTHLGSLKSGG